MEKCKIGMHCLCETMRNILLKSLIKPCGVSVIWCALFAVQVIPKASKKGLWTSKIHFIWSYCAVWRRRLLGRDGTHWDTLNPQGRDILMDRLADWVTGRVGFQQGSSELETEAQSKRESCNGEGTGGRGLPRGCSHPYSEDSMCRSFPWTPVQKLWGFRLQGYILSQFCFHWSPLQFCPYSWWEWHWDPYSKIGDIVLGFTGSMYSFFFLINTILKPKWQNNKLTHG